MLQLTLIWSRFKTYNNGQGGGKIYPKGISSSTPDRNKIPAATPCFGVKRFNGTNADIMKPTTQPEIQYGGHKTEVLTTHAVR